MAVWRVLVLHELKKGFSYYRWEPNILIPSLATFSKLAPEIKPAGIDFPELCNLIPISQPVSQLKLRRPTHSWNPEISVAMKRHHVHVSSYKGKNLVGVAYISEV